MAFLYLWEFANTSSSHGRSPSMGQLPPIAAQKIAIGAGSLQSAPFSANTNMIRVEVDTTCFINVGVNPTADSSQGRLATNQAEYFGVSPGHILAVIQGT